MNSSIRKVALGLALAYLALFANLNVYQLARSEDLTADSRNRRNIIAEYGTRRGEIIARGNTVIARSVVSDSGQYKYRREYPMAELFGHITGYYSFFYGASGLERTYNATMLGKEPRTSKNFVDSLLGREAAGNVLQLSIDPDLQELAKRKIGSQRGAAALIDSNTGAVLALYATPSYDPNPLSASPRHQSEIRDAWAKLADDARRPLTFRATAERYPPGSTFKIITTAAALELGKLSPNYSLPFRRRLDLPDTDRTLGNFGNSTCGGSMRRALQVSCNTYFAQLGMTVGSAKMYEMASRFGLNAPMPFDIATAPSCLRADALGGCSTEPLSRPHTAYSAIGQFDVRVTPLQMALVTATVGNGGYRLRPTLVQKVLDPEGKVIRETEPQRSKRIYSAKTARALRSMMIDVVRLGTGRIVGFKEGRKGIIGGKTGTAQVGVEGKAPHVWFVAFAPGLAVAVVVENGGSLRSEATGGKVAGPIAKALIEAARAKRLARATS